MTLACRVFTVVLILAFAAPALAGAVQMPQSATEFYQARQAFAKAQKIEEMLPMMAASRRAKRAEVTCE